MQADLLLMTDRRTVPLPASPPFLLDLHLTLPPTLIAVRHALECAAGAVSGLGIRPDDHNAFQTALAEILNNVVEHAYRDDDAGMIEICLRHEGQALVVTVLDNGAEMPGGTLPAGRDDWETGILQTLPEGGFGWYMIRQLVKDLAYTRDGGINRVTFRLPLGPVG